MLVDAELHGKLSCTHILCILSSFGKRKLCISYLFNVLSRPGCAMRCGVQVANGGLYQGEAEPHRPRNMSRE